MNERWYLCSVVLYCLKAGRVKATESKASTTDTELIEGPNIDVDILMNNLSTSTLDLNNLKEHLQAGSVCEQVMKMCTEDTEINVTDH